MSNDNKIIILVILAMGAALVGGVWFAQQSRTPVVEVVDSKNALAEVEEWVYDWGTIELQGGNVSKSFKIANTGSDPLQLSEVQTSCMCTTAEISIDGQVSPKFGMHGKSKWVGEVPPGGEAELTVTFDPAFHGPSGVGDITRQVSLKTNDVSKPELVFNLSAKVVN